MPDPEDLPGDPMHEPITAAMAERLIGGLELVPAMAGSIPEMKKLRDRCLAAGIPALVGCPGGGGRSCGPKTHLLVHEDALPALSELLRDDWNALLEREGVAPVKLAPGDLVGDDPPCPACGTAAPLVGGACADCGLQLE